MTYWEAVILGVVQGLTEFLPVSSSGHLVLGKAVLGIAIEDIAFEVFVHFGTLLAVVTIFKEDVFLVLRTLVPASFHSRHETETARKADVAAGRKLLILLIVGTIPAATIGFMFKELFEEAFTHPEFVCTALIVTGVWLFLTRFVSEKHEQLNVWQSLIVGIAQIAAILPGISRSGATISTAMLQRVNRIEAARFSFLLAIPLILGATAVKSLELFANLPTGQEIFAILIGTVMAYLSGLFAIKWLLGVVEHGRFDRFAYYCFAVGITGLVISLV